jgi:trehalose 6-phosphate synthase/phosphatase
VEGKMKVVDPTQMESMKIKRSDRQRLERQLERDHGGKIVPVWLVDDVSEEDDIYTIKDQSRWRQFAERELYTLFHYKQNEPADGRAARKAWADYYKLNKLFADRILEIYKPGDVVLIHDYNLMLLPSLLRQRLPNVYIGFFLHIPFPSSEYYRCLSRRKEILEGVLGANMVGFQSFGYSRHFSSCCTRILGFDSSSAGVDAYGAHVAVDVFPIGINALSAQKAAYNDPLVEEKMAGILQLYAGKRIIIGRDRLDTVRGVSQKLEAFETFLEKYDEWRDKVVLIQITSPNATNTAGDGEESKFMDKISDLASKINGKYGSLSFSPVKHFPQYLSKEEYFALLRVANVALITSVRDGMNTTSLEYVVCQKDNYGPLILSEFSGTSASLSDAIQVNPWDLGGVADAINYALCMTSEERKDQHEKLYRHVVKNNVQNWTNKYIKRLLINLESFDHSFATPALDRAKLLSTYRAAKKRLFMFDYDGTLTPIVKDPQSAIPSDRILRTIKTLAADPANTVWIVSGRDQAFLDEYMGHISELGLSAEHGCFMRQPKSDDWENVTKHMDMSWQEEVHSIFQVYTDKTQGSFIERKKIALTWHYRRADPEYGLQMSRECQKKLETAVARKHDVEVMTGKANLEVRPRFVNKGEIAKKLVKAYGSGPGDAPEFVLCLGDDSTDEGLFFPSPSE